eukprot:5013184-Pleurochrysis_carterae.AAC.1
MAKWARALCFRRYRRQRLDTGSIPSGASLERSCGTCATENDAHGGAANTAPKRRSRIHRRISPATLVRVSRSSSRPPMR